MKQTLFFIINFQREKANTSTFLIILIVKSLQLELHCTNLLQSPQGVTTSRKLTLLGG